MFKNKLLSFLLFSFALTLLTLLFLSAPSQTHAAISDPSWQKGATFFPKSTEMYATAAFRQSVDDLAATGANYAGLLVPYYQSNKSSSDIQRGWNTATDSSLLAGIDYVHSKGMKVFLIIHLDTLNGEWHAMIQPVDRNTWFANYGNILNKYATIAQSKNVELMSLGVELWGVTSEKANYDNKTRWQTFITNVKQRYTGKLTYGAQHTGAQSEKFEVSFWKDLDFIGISAYFPLNRTGGTIEQNLYNSWNDVNKYHIKPLYDQYKKPILFTELGYRSIADSHLEPWSYWSTKPLDLAEQARSYEALFSYWKDYSYMVGWHIWAWEGDPNAGGPTDKSFTPQNKPAEDVLKKWYGGGGQTTNPITPVPPQEPEPPTPPVEGTPNSVAFTPSTATTGTSTQIKVNFTPTSTYTNNHLILFVYDSAWKKMYQKEFLNQSFTSGVTKSYSIEWTPQTAGTYHISLGLFDTSWKGTLWQNYLENKLVVTSSGTTPVPPPPAPPTEPTPPPPPLPVTSPKIPILPAPNAAGFSSLSAFSVGQVNRGQTVTVKSYFKSLNSQNNVNVDVEIFDSNWKKVHQKIFSSQNLVASTVAEYSFDWTPTQPGKYHIKVGIFTSGWQNLYWYSEDGAVLSVL